MNDIKLNVEQQLGIISINFDEIKEHLALAMKEYQGMVFAEDSKAEAKRTVAELRKLKKAINDRRIEVKKSFMQPYAEFEQKVKELDRLIDEPITFISGQVEAFEKKRVEERVNDIKAIYAECIGELEEFLPLLKIYDYKWENATTSKKAICEEIEAHVKTVSHDIETIRDMQTDAVDKALEKYKETLCLADAISFVNNWERQKQELLEKQEEQKVAEQERMAELKAIKKEQIGGIATTEPEEKGQSLAGPVVCYEVQADAFQIAQLEAAMRKLGITYRRV